LGRADLAFVVLADLALGAWLLVVALSKPAGPGDTKVAGNGQLALSVGRTGPAAAVGTAHTHGNSVNVAWAVGVATLNAAAGVADHGVQGVLGAAKTIF